VFHRLSEFIECETLGVVYVKEAEAALEVDETLRYFTRNQFKQLLQLQLLLGQFRFWGILEYALTTFILGAPCVWIHDIGYFITIIFVT